MKFHRLTLGVLGTNCYAIANENTKQAILIDAPDNPDLILEFLKENDYTLDKIVLTHGHFDHILALPVLLKTTKAPLYIHENGKIFLEESEYNLAFHLDVDWKPITADHYLKDGDVISLGDKSIKVIHTPGHTSDCICLLVDDILISGDTLFQGSVGRIDHPTGDLSMEVNSIKQKLMPLSDDIKVYPGHGNDTTIGSERRENPYLR